MNIRRSWVKMALLLLLSAAIGFAVPATLAYIAVSSAAVVNTFDAPYFPAEQTSVEVRVQKTVRNIGTDSIGPQDFQFVLQNIQTEEKQVQTTGLDGSAVFVLSFC